MDDGIVFKLGSSASEFIDPWALPDIEDVVVGDDKLSSMFAELNCKLALVAWSGAVV